MTQAQIKDWVEKNVGEIIQAKRCKISKKLNDHIRSTFQKISEYMGGESTGTLTTKAMGF